MEQWSTRGREASIFFIFFCPAILSHLQAFSKTPFAFAEELFLFEREKPLLLTSGVSFPSQSPATSRTSQTPASLLSTP